MAGRNHLRRSGPQVSKIESKLYLRVPGATLRGDTDLKCQKLKDGMGLAPYCVKIVFQVAAPCGCKHFASMSSSMRVWHLSVYKFGAAVPADGKFVFRLA